MNLTQAIACIEESISDPKRGLPFEVFKLISRLTPMVNVDLLVTDKKNRVLLAWRDDIFAGEGWHIPGGIVRFKENLNNRIRQVAISEIGTDVEFSADPIAINQVICSHDTRGHFISLLFKCHIDTDFIPNNKDLSAKDPGYLFWHDHCPENLVQVHEMYRQYISSSTIY